MTYQLKIAEESDRSWVVNIAAKEMIENEVGRLDLYSAQQLHLIYHKVVEDKTGIICWKDGVRVGLVVGILLPHHLKPSYTVLTEVVWYIHNDHRKSRATVMMLKAYRGLIDSKADEGVFTLLTDTPISDSSMERFGFQPAERNFIYRKTN